jgi:hypothetical protein
MANNLQNNGDLFRFPARPRNIDFIAKHHAVERVYALFLVIIVLFPDLMSALTARRGSGSRNRHPILVGVAIDLLNQLNRKCLASLQGLPYDHGSGRSGRMKRK